MSTLATILLIAIAPFNSLLALDKIFDNSSRIVKSNTGENSGFVEGIERDKKELEVKKDVIAVPIPRPVKKDTAMDLAVPNAHSALILDVDSKTVLFDNDGNERRQIASLTKMMTATLVMEKVSNLEELATVDEEAVYTEGTRVGCPRSGYCISQRLKIGEKISVINLLKAMLMNSANDAAITLAKHISGTQDAFVELMNKKAKESGLKDSHFCTASGLEPEGKESGCYSTAHDIAVISANSMKYDLIWDIMRLPNNTIVTSADGIYSHTILNTDIVLNDITNCIGGKTGFTPLAGRSLLLAASDPTGKHKIIAVLLDDPYRWQDIKTMINWA
ncbi:MAG: hypothetical protein Q7S18_02890, partial [bacterium]|nr:hypothetical protein [bacterium]